MDIGHAFEPRELAFGKAPRPGLDAGCGVIEGHLSLEIQGQFLIADGLHGLTARRDALVQQVPHFINPAGGNHGVDALFNAPVQDIPRQAQTDDVSVIDYIPSLAGPDERFSFALLDGADQAGQAVRVGKQLVPVRRLPVRFCLDIGLQFLLTESVDPRLDRKSVV